MKRLSCMVALALAATALLASSATAEIKWSHSTASWQGTLTFKRNGTNPKTCTFTGSHALSVGGEFFLPTNPFGWEVGCGGGLPMKWAPEGYAVGNKAEGYSLVFWDLFTINYGWTYRSGPWAASPSWYPGFEEATVPFTNASGGNPSKITFNETYLGEVEGGAPVTATGTLKVLTPDGKSSVTLSGE